MPRLTVALQESREALGRGDDATARQVTRRVAEDLREVVARMER